MEEQIYKLTKWAAVAGKWKFKEDSVVYLGPEDPNSTILYGVALGNARARSGSTETRVHFFEKPQASAGRIIFGYNPQTREYFSVGLGGYNFAYVLDEFSPTRGWKALAAAGSIENFTPNSEFQIETRIYGQRVSLLVDSIKVVEHNLPRPLDGDHVGLFAWGSSQVEFKATKVAVTRPKVFVVMQFGEPYDSLYTEVIKPVAEEMGLEAYRVDDVYMPGIILQDIRRGIIEAEVVIAEITPPNLMSFTKLVTRV